MSAAPSMSRMRRFLPAAILTAVVALGSLAVACGGGGTPEPADGVRITDPARVPSSTPIANPVLYRIQGNQVTLVGDDTTAQLTPITGSTPTGRTIYTIQSGDTCSAIAADQGVTLDQLTTANPNTDCGNLQPDDTMIIPGGSGGNTGGGTRSTPAPTQSSGSGETYTVQSGETCSDVAASYGVSVSAIISLNGLDSDCNLREGQVVKIP